MFAFIISCGTYIAVVVAFDDFAYFTLTSFYNLVACCCSCLLLLIFSHCCKLAEIMQMYFIDFPLASCFFFTYILLFLSIKFILNA